jgi:hypothetical protein
MAKVTPFNPPDESYRANQEGLPDWLFKIERAIRNSRSGMISLRKPTAMRLCELAKTAFTLLNAMDKGKFEEARSQLKHFTKLLEEAEITAHRQKEGLPKEP